MGVSPELLAELVDPYDRSCRACDGKRRVVAELEVQPVPKNISYGHSRDALLSPAVDVSVT
jgi:hypothetical protein